MDETAPVNEHEPVDAVFVLGIVSLVLVLIAWAVLGVMGAGRSKQASQFEAKINDFDTKISAFNDTQSDYKSLETVIHSAKKLRETRFVFGPTWAMLRDSVPKDVQFSSVILGSDTTIRIAGSTKSITSVAEFADKLETQTGVSMVTPLAVEKQPSSELMTFSLSFKAVEASGDDQ